MKTYYNASPKEHTDLTQDLTTTRTTTTPKLEQFTMPIERSAVQSSGGEKSSSKLPVDHAKGATSSGDHTSFSDSQMVVTSLLSLNLSNQISKPTSVEGKSPKTAKRIPKTSSGPPRSRKMRPEVCTPAYPTKDSAREAMHTSLGRFGALEQREHAFAEKAGVSKRKISGSNTPLSTQKMTTVAHNIGALFHEGVPTNGKLAIQFAERTGGSQSSAGSMPRVHSPDVPLSPPTFSSQPDFQNGEARSAKRTKIKSAESSDKMKPEKDPVQHPETARGATLSRFSPFDSSEQRDVVFRKMVAWDFLKGLFSRVDTATCVQFMQQLSSSGIPDDLLVKLQKLFSSFAKLCPRCNIPFSAVTERYYHCAKKNNPYNIYKCSRCVSQSRIGEYSDMHRLSTECKQFKKLNDDVTLGEWTCEEITGTRCWKVKARGQMWTRCNETSCCALYKYYRGTVGKHTIEKHRDRMNKK